MKWLDHLTGVPVQRGTTPRSGTKRRLVDDDGRTLGVARYRGNGEWIAFTPYLERIAIVDTLASAKSRMVTRVRAI